MDENDYDVLWCQSECGYTWELDFEPDPDCGCDVYRLGFEYPNGTLVWSEWRDGEGNAVR